VVVTTEPQRVHSDFYQFSLSLRFRCIHQNVEEFR
jgi:hypothetical protein